VGRTRRGLRLRAADPEDIQVLSSFLQDALVRVGDMGYERRARRFVLVLNRYRWEAPPGAGHAQGSRVRTGVHFQGVLAARSKGIARDDPDQVIELLTVDAALREDGAGTIVMVFAGGALICLDVECIACELSDLGEPWPARHRPRHRQLTDG